MNSLEPIKQKVFSNQRLSRDEGIILFSSHDLLALGRMASSAAQRKKADRVYFVQNMHINPTNLCVNRCKFCAFSRSKGEAGAYEMSIEDILTKARSAEQGVRELHIVSGLHSDLPFSWYLDMLSTLKREVPHLHIKAFTAVEIDYCAKLSGRTVKDTLLDIRAQNYIDWVLNLLEKKNILTQNDYTAAAHRNIASLIRSGTTTVAEISTHGISPLVLRKSGLRAVIFHEIISMAQDRQAFVFPRLRSASRLIRYGYPPHSLIRPTPYQKSCFENFIGPPPGEPSLSACMSQKRPNLWDEMRYAYQVHQRSGVIPQDIFHMATMGGANALGMN